MPTIPVLGALLLLNYPGARVGPTYARPLGPDVFPVSNSAACVSLAASNEFATWISGRMNAVSHDNDGAGLPPAIMQCMAPAAGDPADAALSHRLLSWSRTNSIDTPGTWETEISRYADRGSCRVALHAKLMLAPIGSADHGRTAYDCVAVRPPQDPAWIPVSAFASGISVGTTWYAGRQTYRANAVMPRMSLVVGDARPDEGACRASLDAVRTLSGMSPDGLCVRGDKPRGYSLKPGAALFKSAVDGKPVARLTDEAIPGAAPPRTFSTMGSCVSYGSAFVTKVDAMPNWSVTGAGYACVPVYDR